jgi:beta-lactamase superfamily II metal-dependent hydrolase
MILEIFDVEHGACAFITTSNGKRVMIDCGHNATTGWRPGTFLRSAGVGFLDRLYVTNYDEDHVSGYPNLADNVRIGGLYRNPSVLAGTIRHLKSEDGMGLGIERLVWSIENYFTGGSPPIVEDYGDTKFTLFWNQYSPFADLVPGYFNDENNLSLVVFVSCGQHKFIFPGDMEKPGWRQLLLNPAFVSELHSVNVFIASHHGRENGYCEEVLNLCSRLDVVIMSDKKMGFQSQEILHLYRKHVRGFTYNGNPRHILTTARDGYMCFMVPALGLIHVTLSAAAAA